MTGLARRRLSVENLLDYAVLKALAEKLLVASIDRRGIRWRSNFTTTRRSARNGW